MIYKSDPAQREGGGTQAVTVKHTRHRNTKITTTHKFTATQTVPTAKQTNTAETQYTRTQYTRTQHAGIHHNRTNRNTNTPSRTHNTHTDHKPQTAHNHSKSEPVPSPLKRVSFLVLFIFRSRIIGSLLINFRVRIE